MRILMLIPEVFYSTRGTPLSAYHRTRELVRSGYDVDVLTYPLGSPPPDLDVAVFRARGPRLFKDLPAGPSYRKLWFDLLVSLSLVVRLWRQKYDLIYAHEEGGFIASIASRLFRVPYVHDMHSSLPLQVVDWGFSRNRAVVACFRWAEQVSIRSARAVVAISTGVAEAAKQAVPGVQPIIIPNRYELMEAPRPECVEKLRRELGLADTGAVVLYTGSFVALQALDLLVQAVPLVIPRAPRVRFLLVGGYQPEIDALAALARELHVSEHMMFVRARPESEMPAFMALSEVVVSPRVQGINPPGKLFSYLSSGKPVVAANTPVHNQILSRDCAILTPPTAEGLADGILTALFDEAERRRVLAGARRILETTYGLQAQREAYERLFVQLDGRRAEEGSRDRL